MKTSDFDFSLPKKLIAQRPASPRDHSRLLVVYRDTQTWQHDVFYHLPNYLTSNDVLVMNNSRVLPFRLHGIRERIGADKKKFRANAKLLLLKETQPGVWEALARPGRRLERGDTLIFSHKKLILEFVISKKLPDGRVLVTTSDPQAAIYKKLEALGTMPTPPYIHTNLSRKEQYQTIYAHVPGSAAAPTAGFHFTKRVLSDLAKKSIPTLATTLHVGLGTFRSIETDDIEDHTMHAERIFLDTKTATTLNRARKRGRRIISVGTTSLRTLESLTDAQGHIHATPKQGKETDIFIKPGYAFRITGGLLTNFHVPRSSLFVLVSAFAGTDFMKRVYAEAIKEQYRFFSFGDAMLIL